MTQRVDDLRKLAHWHIDQARVCARMRADGLERWHRQQAHEFWAKATS